MTGLVPIVVTTGLTDPSKDESGQETPGRRVPRCFCPHMHLAPCRKQILKFLDAEKDISVLKGTLKPGDIIHYIFDRESTMIVSQNLYELLPRTSPLKNKHFPSCAIVGNSGVLLNSGCGPEIDMHSFVIRYMHMGQGGPGAGTKPGAGWAHLQPRAASDVT